MEALLHDPKTWIALSFIVFMGLFIKYAMPFILKGLDSRSARIKDELDEAIRLREDAQALLVEYQKKQKEMIAEAENLMKAAKLEAERMQGIAETELKETIERRTRLANEKIARAETDALSDIQSNMVDLAVAAAEQLIVDHLQDNDDAMDVAVKDLKRILH